MDVKEKTKKVDATVSTSGPIRTIQEMWNAAVDYFYSSKSDIDAMKAIYARMITSPYLGVQDLANVLSGVYADTYWQNICLDYTILSSHLQSGLGLSSDVANTYASNSIKQWRGIYSRKNSADTGSIPTIGDYYSSLDVICTGKQSMEPNEIINKWNDPIWVSPVIGKNYVYVRCSNIQFLGNIVNPKVQMFYTYGGFNQPPSVWTQMKTYDSGNDEGVVYLSNGKTGPMQMGAKGVSEAFSFEPTKTDHGCILSGITTEFLLKNNPKNITPGNWNYATYVTRNGSAAWHNFDAQKSTSSKLAFYNQDGASEVFSFIANCRNVPIGSKIGLKSNDPKCLFDSGLIEIKNSFQQISQQVAIPANYSGELIVTMTDKHGNMLPANAAVEICMKWVLNKGHKTYAKALKHIEAIDEAINSEEITLHMGSFTLTGGGPEISEN